jgi:PEP-CTERM/exosortase A-associated glycosyltransferase
VRILHVLDHSIPIQDGYSHRTLAILAGQAALGWETVHLTSGKQGPGTVPLETVRGIAFHRTPQPSGWLARLPAGGQVAVIRDLVRRLDELIPQERPDAIHAHSPSLNGVAAVIAGRRHRIPVVYEVRSLWEDAAVDHGTSSEWGPRYLASRALETWVLRRADRVTTICEGLRAEIQSRGVARERITVIPNGVDAQMFSPRVAPDPELARELGLAGGPVVGFIGSFYGYEGLALLVDAMQRLATRRSDVKALLVGGGQQLDAIRAKIAALGLSGSVITTGSVPHAQVPRYYDLIDVLVYPRLSMRLTEMVTPLKPLEAMARRQLVLASDIGGHRELIRHGQTGFLFPPDDPEQLAAAIERLVEHRETWELVQAAARRYVETERTWSICTAGYRDVFPQLVGASRS